MPFDIETLRSLCGSDQVVYSKHFVDRCRQRGISLAGAEAAILSGEIIEEYPDDYPYPSCLILGTENGQDNLHVVCAYGDGRLYMISAYRPSLLKWEADWKTRRKEPTHEML